MKPDIARGRSLKLVTAQERNLICQANGCRAMFAEQKEVNRNAHICHPVEVVAVTEGTGASPGAAAADADHCATGQVRRRPVNSAVTTVGGRTGLDGVLSLHCPAPGCSKVFKTPGWLARHIKSSHTGLAVPVKPNTPPSVMVADVRPTPLPNPTLVRGQHREAPGGVWLQETPLWLVLTLRVQVM